MNPEQNSIGQVILAAIAKGESTAEVSRFDAELLLADVLGKSRAYLRAYAEDSLTKQQILGFQQRLSRRQRGEPLAYILGTKEFWSLTLKVTPHVLIPRPETELLVSYLLENFGEKSQCRVLDLGTGSGAIACAVASEKPKWSVLAVDQSKEALAVAKGNARANHLDNIEFSCSDWFEKIEGTFDLVLSNPPYIDENDPHLMRDGLQYEPQAALIAGKNGYADLFYLIKNTKQYLKPNACLVLEHGYEQAEKVRLYFQQQGYLSVQTLKDLNGLDRVTLGYL